MRLCLLSFILPPAIKARFHFFDFVAFSFEWEERTGAYPLLSSPILDGMGRITLNGERQCFVLNCYTATGYLPIAAPHWVINWGLLVGFRSCLHPLVLLKIGFALTEAVCILQGGFQLLFLTSVWGSVLISFFFTLSSQVKLKSMPYFTKYGHRKRSRWILDDDLSKHGCLKAAFGSRLLSSEALGRYDPVFDFLCSFLFWVSELCL